MVEVDHGGGLTTRYLHLGSVSVAAGQPVGVGEQIGTEGSTGGATGPHLHFEVRQGGVPLDPRAWFTGRGVDVDTGEGLPPAPPATSTPPPELPTPTVVATPPRVGAYAGQQVVNAATIITVGSGLGVDTWTVTVAVMTAIGESGLVNLDHGDGAGPDSRGVFQQRDNGAWGSLAERMTPAVAAAHFYAALLAVPGYRDMQPTLAAHAVQRNADPWHYAPFWDDAVAIVAAVTGDPRLLTGLAGGQPTPPGVACPQAGTDPGGPVSATAGQVLSIAASFAGVPYVWGGTSPSGFDCSGYTQYVFARVGVALPRSRRPADHSTASPTATFSTGRNLQQKHQRYALSSNKSSRTSRTGGSCTPTTGAPLIRSRKPSQQ